MSSAERLIQVFVAGEWRIKEAEPFAHVGREVGRFLAEVGFVLTCGPGSGLARYVLEGYDSVRSERPQLPKPRFYLPKLSEMSRVGEKEETYGIDVEIIETGLDYPSRNIMQVRESDAMIAIGGGVGTLQEVTYAAYDFDKPVAVLESAGDVVSAIKQLSRIRDQVFFGSNAKELVDYIKAQLAQKTKDTQPPPGNSVFIST